ncbi:jg183 [Pararge aegeria aegeria]|uniref:Jg183 protein n=1 Tax=Pararge aegeria aegeria TaxID=348720 RepID=A0A8S4QML6_9NEOP|nr:jg183 [Pararge aegeria aegeria]
MIFRRFYRWEIPLRSVLLYFEKHISETCTLPADLRSACYRAVLAEADEAVFQRFLQLYRAADLHEEKDRISRALGAVKDPALLKRVLEFAISVSPFLRVRFSTPFTYSIA